MMNRWIAAFLLLALAARPQTRVHGPSQVRDISGGHGSVAWYYGPSPNVNIAAGQCFEWSFPADGVSPGQNLAPGWPYDLPANVYGMMYSGADLIVVRLCSSQAVSIPPRTYSAAIVLWR
jgi:hypothetical protein